MKTINASLICDRMDILSEILVYWVLFCALMLASTKYFQCHAYLCIKCFKLNYVLIESKQRDLPI